MQNISPIKERILQFVDTHCSSKRDFYVKTGISRGTLESKTGISEETFTKLFATYQKLSPVWVLTGDGSMMLDHSDDSGGMDHRNTVDCIFCKEKDRTIMVQKDHISLLKENALLYKEQITELKSKLASAAASMKNAG